MKHIKRTFSYILGWLRWSRDVIGLFWKRAWWSKTILVSLAVVFGVLLGAYGISRWYAASVAGQPRELGVTFIADYARSLGVNPEETMDALISDVGVERFRLVSYWNKIEATEGQYDFSELDRQFEKVEAIDGEVTLTLGLRQPRWPECHAPAWVDLSKPAVWEPKLNAFITAVVNRYKDSSVLKSYQLENEYFLEAFGECPKPERKRLQAEFDLVKQLDPQRPVIMTRMNNYPAIVAREPRPDQVGMSVYRRVWDGNVTKSYFTYPLPSWYYGAVAGVQKILTGRESMLHEMQMEPWPAHGQFVTEVSLEEQDKTFKAEDFASRIDFAKDTGLRTIDLWGAEWWYWRMVEQGDPDFWNAAKEAFTDE